MRQLAIPARRVLLVSLAECFVCSEHLGPLADVLQAHEQSDGTGQQRALLQIFVLQSVLRCSGVMLRKCHLNAHGPFIEKSLHACMHLPETHHGRWHWTHFPLACTQPCHKLVVQFTSHVCMVQHGSARVKASLHERETPMWPNQHVYQGTCFQNRPRCCTLCTISLRPPFADSRSTITSVGSVNNPIRRSRESAFSTLTSNTFEIALQVLNRINITLLTISPEYLSSGSTEWARVLSVLLWSSCLLTC